MLTYYKSPNETVDQYNARTTGATSGVNLASATTNSPTITSAALSGPSINLPPPPVDQTNYSGIVAGAQASADSINGLFDKYMASQEAPPSLDSQYSTDYANSGIDTKQATSTQSRRF